jgi:hypothetical protein
MIRWNNNGYMQWRLRCDDNIEQKIYGQEYLNSKSNGK